MKHTGMVAPRQSWMILWSSLPAVFFPRSLRHSHMCMHCTLPNHVAVKAENGSSLPQKATSIRLVCNDTTQRLNSSRHRASRRVCPCVRLGMCCQLFSDFASHTRPNLLRSEFPGRRKTVAMLKSAVAQQQKMLCSLLLVSLSGFVVPSGNQRYAEDQTRKLRKEVFC